MARPRKPDHMKVVSGTDQPCRREANSAAAQTPAPLVADIPPAPDWLPNAHAVKEWNRLCAIMVELELLTDAGLTTLGHLCALHGKIVQLWAAGQTPTGHLLAQYNKMIDSLGVPLSGKGRPVDAPKGNRFSKFRDEQAG